MREERNTVVFSQIRQGGLFRRMRRELADAARELAHRPSDYLRAAFLPDRLATWFPARLAREASASLSEFRARPVKFINGAFDFDNVSARVLILSVCVLVTFVALREILAYTSVLTPYSSFRLVSRKYRDYKEPVMLGPLHYPPQMLPRRASPQNTMTLEEIRERDEKRREEAARREREKAERDRLAKEKADKQKEAAELAKAEENKEGEKAEPSSGEDAPSEIKFGEINEAPIKDIVSRTYARYKEGKLDIPTTELTVEAGFEIEKDGSLSKVRLIKRSGSEIIDREALAILYAISESHALSPISHLTSNTIRFDLDSKTARLTITGFAPSAREASNQAGALNLLLYAARITQQSKSPETAELLSLVKVKSDNKRIDAEMMVSRARASEMMRARFK